MTMLRAYVSDVKLQDIVVENIINNHLLPVLAAYGPIPEIIASSEQVSTTLGFCLARVSLLASAHLAFACSK